MNTERGGRCHQEATEKATAIGEASWEVEGGQCHFYLQVEQQGGLWELRFFSITSHLGKVLEQVILQSFPNILKVIGHSQQVFIKGSWALWSVQSCSEPRGWHQWYWKVPSNLINSVIFWSLLWDNINVHKFYFLRRITKFTVLVLSWKLKG